MKKITRVVIIMPNGNKSSVFPDKVVENIEAYRAEIKELFNAKIILLDTEEIE